jgi:hypothetical protein
MEPPLPSWCDIEFDSPSMPGGTTAMQKFATMRITLHGDSAHPRIPSSSPFAD